MNSNGKENNYSATPEYFKVFNREEVSYNKIREESSGLAIAFEQIVRSKQHYGQMTLPEPVGTGDIIYPPMEFPHHFNGMVEMQVGIDYSLMQQ